MENDEDQPSETVSTDDVETGEEGDVGPVASNEPSDAPPGAVTAVLSDETDVATEPAHEDDGAPPGKKKKRPRKKKNVGLGSSRGIETMFRTSYRVHQDLVGLADTKANIMISVNGLIISIILGTVAPRLAGARWLALPTSFLLIGCVIALVYAVLAARPRVSNIPLTLEDIARNDANILFFGNFVNLSEGEFVEGMRDLMLSQDHLYVNMVRDLYGLGQVLKTKFRLLRISYTVFMFALAVGVGLFVVVFAIDAIMAGGLLGPQDVLPIIPS